MAARLRAEAGNYFNRPWTMREAADVIDDLVDETRRVTPAEHDTSRLQRDDG